MTDEKTPAQEPAEAAQDAPDNVVSLSAHAIARSGFLAPPSAPEPEPEKPAPDANDAAPARPVLRAFTPPEVAALVAQCTRSGSSRTRRGSAHALGKQVTDLQNALLNFRAYVQKAMAQVVSVQDAALAVIRVATPDGAPETPRTIGEMRVMAEVKRILESVPEEPAPAVPEPTP